jgi:hypothetical protein
MELHGNSREASPETVQRKEKSSRKSNKKIISCGCVCASFSSFDGNMDGCVSLDDEDKNPVFKFTEGRDKKRRRSRSPNATVFLKLDKTFVNNFG